MTDVIDYHQYVSGCEDGTIYSVNMFGRKLHKLNSSLVVQFDSNWLYKHQQLVV